MTAARFSAVLPLLPDAERIRLRLARCPAIEKVRLGREVEVDLRAPRLRRRFKAGEMPNLRDAP